MPASILVVDDDDDLRALLTVALQESGYVVSEACDGPTALTSFARQPADLVVLDIGLGEMDGLEVCRRLRATSDVPLVFLTSRSDEVDQLVGFAIGADDYVTKPFSPKLLVARIGSVLRRRNGVAAGPTTADDGIVRAEGIALDDQTRSVTVDGEAVELTRIEFDLLAVLMENPRRVVPRAEIVERVWGPWFGDDHVLEVHLSRLRRKVVRAGGPRVDLAVRGVGYRFAP